VARGGETRLLKIKIFAKFDYQRDKSETYKAIIAAFDRAIGGAQGDFDSWIRRQEASGRVLSIVSVDSNVCQQAPYFADWSPIVQCIITVKYYGDAVE
jgi:hypothetical protein